MNPDITALIQRTFNSNTGSEAKSDALEILDLIPIPRSTDRMVRFRGIQQILEEFDTEDENTYSWVVQVRRKEPTKTQGPNPSNEPVPDHLLARAEDIYRSDGTLNADFLLQNAELLFSAGDYPAARQIFSTLRRVGSHTSEALLGLARCFEAEGSMEHALKAYEESILYHPQLQTYQRYAALLIRLKRDQQAAEILERSLLIRGVDDRARFEMLKAAGNCWLRTEAFSKAESSYRQALSIRPESDLVSGNLGALLLQTGKTQEALAIFQQASRVNPRNHQASTGVATAQLALGQKTEAYQSFVKSLKTHLAQPKAIYHLVKLSYELKRYADAAEILHDYIETSPFNANLLYSLAGLEFHLQRYDRCLRTIRQILEIQPNHQEAIKLKARIQGK